MYASKGAFTPHLFGTVQNNSGVFAHWVQMVYRLVDLTTIPTLPKKGSQRVKLKPRSVVFVSYSAYSILALHIKVTCFHHVFS